MYDVGGQRGERKKWIRCFDDVSALMFITSLSEYDQVLLEDAGKNRMAESVTLFAGIINLPWFRNTPIILFFNKMDIFAKKIEHIDPGDFFSDYEGGCDMEAALGYIKSAYLACNKSETAIYHHMTTATSTDNISFVWAACKSIILGENLKHTGLI
jgi:guanine nucleotide-binding protein G(i) subunit alpha